MEIVSDQRFKNFDSINVRPGVEGFLSRFEFDDVYLASPDDHL